MALGDDLGLGDPRAPTQSGGDGQDSDSGDGGSSGASSAGGGGESSSESGGAGSSSGNASGSGGGSSGGGNSSGNGGGDSGGSDGGSRSSTTLDPVPDDVASQTPAPPGAFDGTGDGGGGSGSSSGSGAEGGGESTNGGGGGADGNGGGRANQSTTIGPVPDSLSPQTPAPPGAFNGRRSGSGSGGGSSSSGGAEGDGGGSGGNGIGGNAQDPIQFKNTVQFERAVAERISERTGADISRFDVESSVREQGDERDISAQLTESGQQKVASDFEQDTAERLSNQSGADFSAEDIEVQTRKQNGETVRVAGLTESGRDIARTESASARVGQILSSPVTSVRAPTVGQTRPADIGDSRVGQGSSSSSSGSGNGQQSNGSDGGDVFSGAVSATEDALSEVAQVASGDESTRVEFRGDGSLVEAGRQQQRDSSSPISESFLGSASLQQDLDSLSADFQGATKPLANRAGNALAANPLVDIADPTPATSDDLEPNTSPDSGEEQRRGEAFGGAANAAVQTFNVPGLASTGVEGAEIANAGVSASPATGGSAEEVREFAGDVAAAGAFTGAQTANFAGKNPNRFFGSLAGGVVVGSAAETAITSRLRGTPGDGRSSTKAEPPTRSSSGSSGTSGSSGRSGIGPNVDIRAGKNAAPGRVDINIRSDIRRQLDQRLNQAKQTPNRALRQASGAPGKIRKGISQRAGRARQAVRNAEVTADAVAQSAQSRLRTTTSNAALAGRRARRDLGSGRLSAQAQFRASQALDVGAEQASGIRQSVFSRAKGARNRAILAGRRARRDFELPTLSSDGQSLLSDTETGRSRPALGVVDVGVDAGSRARQSVAEAGAALRQGAQNTEVSIDALQASGRARLKSKRSDAIVAARRARRDFDVPQAIISDTRDRGFFSDDSSRRGSTPIDIASPVLSAGESVEDIAADVGQFAKTAGVRVDIGKPGQITVDAEDMRRTGPAGVPFLDDVDDLGDGDGGSADFITGQEDVDIDVGDGSGTGESSAFSLDEQDAGGGTVTVRQTGPDAEPSSGTIRDDVDVSPNTDANIGPTGAAAAGTVGPDISESTGPTLGTGADIGPEIGQGTGVGSDLNIGPDIRSDVRVGSLKDTDIGRRQDVKRDLRTEVKSELRQETRQELKAETRTETRARRADLDVDPRLDDNDSEMNLEETGSSEFSREFEFDVASPEEILSSSSAFLDDIDSETSLDLS